MIKTRTFRGEQRAKGGPLSRSTGVRGGKEVVVAGKTARVSSPQMKGHDGGKENVAPSIHVPIHGREKKVDSSVWGALTGRNHAKEKAMKLIQEFRAGIPSGVDLDAVQTIDLGWRELLGNRDVVHYLNNLDEGELVKLLDTLPIGCAKILAEVQPHMQKQIMGRWMEIGGHSLLEKIWNGVLWLLGRPNESPKGYIPSRFDRMLNAPENERRKGLQEFARWSMLAFYSGKLAETTVLGVVNEKTQQREEGLIGKITDKLGVNSMLEIFGLEVIANPPSDSHFKAQHELLKQEVMRCAATIEGVSIEVVERVLNMREQITNETCDVGMLDDLIAVAKLGLLGHSVFAGVVKNLEVNLTDAVEFLEQKKAIFEFERLKTFDELLHKGPELLEKSASDQAREYVISWVKVALSQGLVTSANKKLVFALVRMCGGLAVDHGSDEVAAVLERVDRRIEVQHKFEEWREGVKTVSAFERGKNWLGKMVGWSSVESEPYDASGLVKPDPLKSVTGTEGSGSKDTKAAQEFWSTLEMGEVDEAESPRFMEVQLQLAHIYARLKYLDALKTIRELGGRDLNDVEKMKLELAQNYVVEIQAQFKKGVEGKGWKEKRAVELMLRVPDDIDGVMRDLQLEYEAALFKFAQFKGSEEYEFVVQQQGVENVLSLVEKGSGYAMYLYNAQKAVAAMMQTGFISAAPLPLLNAVGAVASTRELLDEWKRWDASGILHENLKKMVDGGQGFDSDLAAISRMVNVAQVQRGSAAKTVAAGLNIASYASTVAVLLNPMDMTIGAVGMDPLSMVMWAATAGAVAVGGGWSLYRYYKQSQMQSQVVTARALDERLKILGGRIQVSEVELEVVREQLLEYYGGDEDFVDMLESNPMLLFMIQEKLDEFLLEHDPDYAINEILGWINPELRVVKEDFTPDEIRKRQMKIEEWLRQLGIFTPTRVQAIMMAGPGNVGDVRSILRSALNLA